MADIPPVAHGYNKPDRDSDLEASFNDLTTAQAYADAYGGEVEARGVAFVVGPDADHNKARDDLAEAQRAVPGAAPNVASDLDERIARAVAASEAKLRAEFEAEREAFLAETAETPQDPAS